MNSLSSYRDEDLVAEYRQKGENRYLNELFNRYSHLVYGVCLKYLKDPDDAGDASMSIFEKLITDLKKHHIEFFKAWLHTVTRNHCLMLLRKRKNHIEFTDRTPVENTDEWHQNERIELEIRIDLLNKGIEQLEDHQQICIRMFYIEEKSYHQIMETTGYDFKQVKSYIQNGKRKLHIYMLKNEK